MNLQIGIIGSGSNMTIDEAIVHCREVINNNDCKECIEQHVQLIVWLEELKELREFKNKVARAFMPK